MPDTIVIASDSDDDDVVVFGKPSAFSTRATSRAASRADAKQQQQLAMLDQALQASTRGLQSVVQCSVLKREHLSQSLGTAPPPAGTRPASSSTRKHSALDLDDDCEKLQAQAEVIAQAPKASRAENAERMLGIDVEKLYKDQALPRDKMIERVRALEADGTTSIGVRNNIIQFHPIVMIFSSRNRGKKKPRTNSKPFFDDSNCMFSPGFFETYDEAIKVLKNTTAFTKKKGNDSQSDVVSEKLDSLVASVNRALQADVLEEFMGQGGLSSQILKLFASSSISKAIIDLIRWLYCLILSGDMGDGHLLNLSSVALTELLRLYKGRFENVLMFDCSAGLDLFLSGLKCWINVDDDDAGVTREAVSPLKDGKITVEDEPELNIIGLRNLIEFWQTAIPHCKPCLEIAAKIFASLARISLEKRVFLSYKISILSDKQYLTGTVVKLVDLVAKTENSTVVDNWINSSVQYVFQNLGSCGPGPAGSEDEDDCKALLVHCRIVQLLAGINEACDVTHVALGKVRIYAALFTLKYCLNGTTGDRQQTIDFFASLIGKTLKRTKSNDLLEKKLKLSVAWLAAGSTFAALQRIYDDDNKDDAVRCYAVVTNSFLTFQVALYALVSNLNSVRGEYGTKEDAIAMAALLELIQRASGNLSKRIQRLDHAHYRRADYLLAVFNQYLDFALVNASAQAGQGQSAKLVQKSVINYFNVSP